MNEPLSKEALFARGFEYREIIGYVRDLKTQGDADASIAFGFLPMNEPLVTLRVGNYSQYTLIVREQEEGNVLAKIDALLALFDGCYVDSMIGYEKDADDVAQPEAQS
jgi:hypothetical protein